MKVAVLKESRPGEDRVALVPQGVQALVKKGLEVVVEQGAGKASGVSDDDYREAGASVAASAAVVMSPATAPTWIGVSASRSSARAGSAA